MMAVGQQDNMSQGQQPSMEMMKQVQALKDAWENNPESFENNVNLGNAYFDIGRFDKAVFYYKNANRVMPNNTSVLIDMGVSYFNISKADSALMFIERALKIEPDHIYGLYNTGIIYYNLNRIDDAIAVWKRLIAVHAETQEARTAQQFIEKLQQERQQQGI